MEGEFADLTSLNPPLSLCASVWANTGDLGVAVGSSGMRFHIERMR